MFLYFYIFFEAFAQNCKKSTSGILYQGNVQIAVSGKRCQRWDSQSPHRHSNTQSAMFPDKTVSDAANFCRNPDGEVHGPWCYTTDKKTRWDFCDIPLCYGNQGKLIIKINLR